MARCILTSNSIFLQNLKIKVYKMKLVQLNEWYNRYQNFWTEWKEYKFNGLNEKDILSIELYRDNNFRISISKLSWFHKYDHVHNCLEKPIVIKFQQNYEEYKGWVCMKFRNYIFKRALRYGLTDFFETPLDNLEIEADMKLDLKAFNCRNIQEIFDRYDDSDFLKDELFYKILKFESAIREDVFPVLII